MKSYSRPTRNGNTVAPEQALAKKIARCFKYLERSPRSHPNIKSLKGEFLSLLRFRVGDWRVVYRIDDSKQTVTVIKIAHRSEVYE